jgi:hypothetical protein
MRALGWEIGLVWRGRRPWLRHERLLGHPCLPGAVVLQRQRALSGQALHSFSSRRRVLGRALSGQALHSFSSRRRVLGRALEGKLAQGQLDRGAREKGLLPWRGR